MLVNCLGMLADKLLSQDWVLHDQHSKPGIHLVDCFLALRSVHVLQVEVSQADRPQEQEAGCHGGQILGRQVAEQIAAGRCAYPVIVGSVLQLYPPACDGA